MYLLTRISLVAALAITLGLAAGLARPQNESVQIMEAMGLKSGELITIDLEQMAKSEIPITMNGKDYTIDYAFHSMRSKDYRLLVPNEIGELVEQEAPTVSTIRGSLRGIEGSSVTGCVSEHGCCAKIEFPNGEDCFIEPTNRKINNPALAGVHVVYSSTDLIDDGLKCGGAVTSLAEDERVFASESNVNSRNNGTLYEVQTIIDADFEYFQIFGSVNDTSRQMEMLLNIANRQYESQADIRFTVVSTIVRDTLSSDPYTSSFSNSFLDEVITEYQGTSIVADVCHVFTGANLISSNTGNSIAGVARSFVSAAGDSLPSVCTASGVSISRDRSNNTLHAATVAHELGHNFSLSHCNCAGHTMQTPSNGALEFSGPSLTRLINTRNSLNCLSTFGGSGSGFGLTGNDESNDDLINGNRIFDLNFSTSGTNFNTTTEAGEPDLTNAGSTIWCYVVAEARGVMTLNTFGSDFDTQLQVYESVPGGGLAGLNLVDGGSNDDTFDPAANSFRQSRVEIDVTAGTRYEIRVGGFRSTTSIGAGSEGSIVLNGAFAPSPVLLGDVNMDGTVNFLDISPFIAILSSGGSKAEADINESGEVDFLDISPFIAILSGQ